MAEDFITFSCSYCGAKMVVAETAVGKKETCASCGHAVTVPSKAKQGRPPLSAIHGKVPEAEKAMPPVTPPTVSPRWVFWPQKGRGITCPNCGDTAVQWFNNCPKCSASLRPALLPLFSAIGLLVGLISLAACAWRLLACLQSWRLGRLWVPGAGFHPWGHELGFEAPKSLWEAAVILSLPISDWSGSTMGHVSGAIILLANIVGIAMAAASIKAWRAIPEGCYTSYVTIHVLWAINILITVVVIGIAIGDRHGRGMVPIFMVYLSVQVLWVLVQGFYLHTKRVVQYCSPE